MDLAVAIIQVVKACVLLEDPVELLAKAVNPVAINAAVGRPVARDRVAQDRAEVRFRFNVSVNPRNRLLLERRSSR